MGEICLAVTTYKKNNALRGWLDSTANFGNVAVIHVADDNDGEAQPIAEEYAAAHDRGEYPFPVFYSTGPNGGIAKNKNRSIKFFLTASEAAACKYLVLSDDDIKFKTSDFGEKHIGDLFVKAAQNAGLKHITGYLGGDFGKLLEDGSVRYEPFFQQFPPYAEDEYLLHCLGTQGILLFFHRELVELLGYFDQFPGRYGFEHAVYSMRANRLEGRMPELYPILKNCPNYFGCQGIPNNYEANPNENNATYLQKRTEVYAGVGLSKNTAGV